MQIKVSGKQVDVGEALRTHVEDRLSGSIEISGPRHPV